MFCQLRRAGLNDTLRGFGLSLEPEYLIDGDLTQQGGFQAMNQLLELFGLDGFAGHPGS
jgi:DNA-binding LacI/PurR family transcriptional regulator